MTLGVDCEWGRTVRTATDPDRCGLEPIVEVTMWVDGPEVESGMLRIEVCLIHSAMLRATPKGELEYRSK